MKVLEKRKDQEEFNWEKEVRCECGALLLLDKNDVVYWGNKDIVGDIDYYYSYRCPECQMLYDLDEEKLPIMVKSIAKNKYYDAKRNNK